MKTPRKKWELFHPTYNWFLGATCTTLWLDEKLGDFRIGQTWWGVFWKSESGLQIVLSKYNMVEKSEHL